MLGVGPSLHLLKTSLITESISNTLVILVAIKGVPTERRFYAKAIDRAVDRAYSVQFKGIFNIKNN